MARIYTQQLREGHITTVRSSASALAADPAIGTDVANPTWVSQSLDCTGYDSMFVGFDVTGGTAPTANIQALFRDSEAADGQRWRLLSLGARDGVTLSALAAESTGLIGALSNMIELRVWGHAQVFLRIIAVGGTVAGTTAWTMFAKPGWIRPTLGRR